MKFTALDPPVRRQGAASPKEPPLAVATGELPLTFHQQLGSNAPSGTSRSYGRPDTLPGISAQVETGTRCHRTPMAIAPPAGHEGPTSPGGRTGFAAWVLGESAPCTLWATPILTLGEETVLLVPRLGPQAQPHHPHRHPRSLHSLLSTLPLPHPPTHSVQLRPFPAMSDNTSLSSNTIRSFVIPSLLLLLPRT